jgi:IS605 OrfB family transposase
MVVKLQLSAEQRQLIAATAQSFASACNTINQTVNPKLTNRNSIQAVCYHDIKRESGLTANHVVRACARVAANRLTAKHKGKKVKSFQPTSFDCDARTFQFFEKDWNVSISTTGKRVKCLIRASNYHRGKLTGQTPTSAQICQHRDGEWYAHIQIKNDAPSPIKTTKVIGVDFGRREIAKTSTNKGWDGKSINQVRDKYSRVRSSVQRKATQGTRTTRRRCRNILKRLSGRERRFQQWLNHKISASIITEAIITKSIIAIEDLTGIRDRTNEKPCANHAPLRYRSKTERRRSNSWAFYQLRTFLEYKGIREGIEVIAIPSAYTSQTCHCCLHIGLRTNKQFKCINKACGWLGDADFNGANMIELWGCSVNQPRGSELLSCAIEPGLLKAPPSADKPQAI